MLLCILIRICQGYETENQVLTLRPAQEEKQIDLESEQLTLIAQKQHNATSSRRLVVQLTENGETLIQRASEQTAFARTVNVGQFCVSIESVMDGNSSASLCREYAEPKNSQNSRLQSVLNDRVKIVQ